MPVSWSPFQRCGTGRGRLDAALTCRICDCPHTQVRKTFELMPHTVLRLELEFVKIDSWGREEAFIEVDGVRVWEQTFLYWEGDRNHCGDARRQAPWDICSLGISVPLAGPLVTSGSGGEGRP